MSKIDVPVEIIEQFCRKNHIRKLSLFGSVLRNDFRQESDIDVLVEFEKNGVPGLLGISRMERELSHIFGGRKIDLRTPEDLSKYFRQQVLSTAEVQYEHHLIRLQHMLDAGKDALQFALGQKELTSKAIGCWLSH